MEDLDYLYQTLDGSAPSESEEGSDLIDQNFHIILVEDDPTLGKAIKRFLEKRFFKEVHLFNSPATCLDGVQSLCSNTPFVLISDISFDDNGVDGLLLVDLLKEKEYNFVAIVMTGFASIETAIKATKKGVYHYLTKPFELQNLFRLTCNALEDRLNVPIKRLLNEKEQEGQTEGRQSLARRKMNYKFEIENPTADDIFCGMIGRSEKMKSIFERIKKVSETNSTVLIHGPSGTGKELVANAIHQLSQRKHKHMISVNCGAIPSELLESELFGHTKGAFTGAISDRKGRFELADQGTIFLDEIGDMPLMLQVKLLRVLQNRTIEVVGSAETRKVDVRIITATHRNLEEQVAAGNFREDLFYRLNVIPIVIPPLAERKEDIPLMISFFLKKFTSADGRNKIDFDEKAIEMLMAYDWPGNVRELENLIERLVILRGGNLIKASDLPSKFYRHSSSLEDTEIFQLPDEGIDLKQFLGDIEDSMIGQALKRTRGNKNQASKLLKLNRTTLIEKMKKKGMLENIAPRP